MARRYDNYWRHEKFVREYYNKKELDAQGYSVLTEQLVNNNSKDNMLLFRRLSEKRKLYLNIHYNFYFKIEKDDCIDFWFEAVEQKHLNAIKYFASTDFDINVQNSDFETCLILAVKSDYINIIKFLLKQKSIDVNIQDFFNCSVLLIAIRDGKTDIAKLLLQHPLIDVNIQSNTGRTALMFAIREKNLEIIKLLLQHPNINLELKDKTDKTALDYAGTEFMKDLIFNFKKSC